MKIRLAIAILCCNLIVLASLGNSVKRDLKAKAGLHLSNRFQILEHDADSIDPSVENDHIEDVTKMPNKPSKKRRLQMRRREERLGSTSEQLSNVNELISDLVSGKDDVVQIVPVSEQSNEHDISTCTAGNEAVPKMAKKNDSEPPTASCQSEIPEEYERAYPADDVNDQQHDSSDQEKKAKRNRKKREQRQRRKDKLPNDILTWLNEEPEQSSFRSVLIQMLTSAVFPNLDSSSSRSSPDEEIEHSLDKTCEFHPPSADNSKPTPTAANAETDLTHQLDYEVSRSSDGFDESEQEMQRDQPQNDSSSFADESLCSPSFDFLRQTDALQFVEGLRENLQGADDRVQRLKRHLKKRKRPVSDDEPIWRKRSESIADEGTQTLNSIVQEPLSTADEETQTKNTIVQGSLSIADEKTETNNSIVQESQEAQPLESTDAEPKVVMGIQIPENVTTDQKSSAPPLWSHWYFTLMAAIIPTFILLSLLLVFIRRYQERQRRLSVLDSNILFTNQPKADSINMESDNEDNLFSNSTNMLRRGGIRINY